MGAAGARQAHHWQSQQMLPVLPVPSLMSPTTNMLYWPLPARAPLRGELAVDARAGGHPAQAGALQVPLKLCQVLRLLPKVHLLQHAGADVAHDSCRQAGRQAGRQANVRVRVARWVFDWA